MGPSAGSRLGRTQQHQGRSRAGHQPADSASFMARFGSGRAGSTAPWGSRQAARASWGWDAVRSGWRPQEPELTAGPWQQGSLEAHPQRCPPVGWPLANLRNRVVGEDTAWSQGSAVGLQPVGLSDWAHSPPNQRCYHERWAGTVAARREDR